MNIRKAQVNHMKNPLGFSLFEPVFHWVTEGAKGTKEEAARIVVKKGETVLLDTGFKALDSLGTKAELSLEPRTRYTWCVSVRTDAGEEAVSDEQFFETGKMDEAWTGKWIHSGDAEKDKKRHPVFRKTFTVGKPVKEARLYISGLGMFDACLNGERIGNEYLTPYCNNYDAWVQVITFDVTAQLKDGENELVSALGNGWYNGRFGFTPSEIPYYGTEMKLIAELRIAYEDGTEEVIGTDESWDVTRSNITFSNIYDGEHRDDTLPALPKEKAALTEAPKGKLTDRLSIPVVIREELPAAELITSPKGEKIFDIGQNLAGSFRLSVHDVKPGTRIHLQVGEVLQKGCFYNENLRTAKAEYIYISDGSDIVLQPEFTFYGYRYVKVDGMPEIQKGDLTALVMYSDMDEIGSLVTGDPKINRLIANAEWGKRGNFIDVPTDCPQRDERMGWTGDAEVFSPTAMLQSDAYAFYCKYLYDMETEQAAHEGGVPDVIPAFGVYNGGTCAWGDATTIIPWNMYLYTGDAEILRRHYDAMKSWVDFMKREEDKDHAYLKKFHYGDWLALDGDGGIDSVKGGTSDAYCAAAYELYSTRIVAETAKLLGKEEDAKIYENLAEEILGYINYEFFTPSGRAAIDTQTAYLLALRHGLGSRPDRMAEGLVSRLKRNGGKLQTGFIGTPLLAETLTEIGESDMAYGLLFNEEFPGWLYEVNLGATTIWERWNSMLEDGSVSSTGMNSFNHYSYGAIVSWIYERAAGLRRDPAVPGYRKVVFAPIPYKKLGFADVSYDSPAGKWESHWKAIDSSHVEISLTVPFGCTADVILPYAPEELYTSCNHALFRNVTDGVCHVGPGKYEISYETTRPLRKVYSVDTEINELLSDPAVLSAFKELAPQFTDIPGQYRSASIRQLSEMIPGRISEEMLNQLDQLLFGIE